MCIFFSFVVSGQVAILYSHLIEVVRKNQGKKKHLSIPHGRDLPSGDILSVANKSILQSKTCSGNTAWLLLTHSSLESSLVASLTFLAWREVQICWSELQSRTSWVNRELNAACQVYFPLQIQSPPCPCLRTEVERNHFC